MQTASKVVPQQPPLPSSLAVPILRGPMPTAPPVFLPIPEPPRAPFGDLGLHAFLALILAEIRDLYRADGMPWVVGYSGGKDSTLALQLVWMALAGLPAHERTKPVYVISTDTGVENPYVAAWVGHSLEAMRVAAREQGLPIEVHRLTPALKDTFWVCLLGRGYAAPRHKFRWCTDRLKIRPSEDFILRVASKYGQVMLVLGLRKSESAERARVMKRHEKGRVRDRVSPHGSLANSLVYTPIEDLTNDEVWILLMQFHANPWGRDNKDLLSMYQGASPDNECPLVVDTTTPSCGSSRFGCWTCTMVAKDRSLTAMITNDPDDKAWMRPLVEFRNALDIEDDRHLREYHRSNGSLLVHRGRLVHGAYTQQARADWLRKLLEVQTWIQNNGPSSVRELELISQDELHEIQRIWLWEKHERENLLPAIYQEATGKRFVPRPTAVVSEQETELLDTLREVCDGDLNQYALIRELLGVERKHATSQRRRGLFADLQAVLLKRGFDSEADALEFALERDRARTAHHAPDATPPTDPEADHGPAAEATM